ncbi:hypothetical protein F2Q69_00034038 [Brassica cretica]|uniref:beta-carotene 3-hydroxylase n=1 Tax=Brassica cretica TaxID=69181 RepID=A0A8S9SRV7_BRACR|nr:hypothetical protein F2Q69_00034038 [Brassica cretica]
MAAGLSTALTFKPLHRAFSSSSNLRLHHPTSLTGFSSPLLRFRGLSVCYVVSDRRQSSPINNDESPEKTSSLDTNAIDAEYLALRLAEKLERKKSERFTYLIAAVMSSFGITSMGMGQRQEASLCNGETVAEAVRNQAKTSSSKKRETNRATMLDMKRKKDKRGNC